MALEAPDRIDKVIADSFEGETPLKAFTENVIQDREQSKQDENMKRFYHFMHGEDWEGVVDNDTYAIVEHDKTIGKFFHKPLENLKTPIFMTGSKEDEFITAIDPNYFENTYGSMKEFAQVSKKFLEE